MNSIAFFNNKGGVGKTTLSCNIAAFLASHSEMRVLLVDADPQCNATQLLLSDELLETIYTPVQSNLKTLYDVCRPLQRGDSQIETIQSLNRTLSRFKTDLLPGHPRMSILEDRLSDAWDKLKGGEISGARVSNWCAQLLKQNEPNYEFVIFDVGPSLGALNRTILLACDFIVTPFGCDIFSLAGIRNISEWISEWEKKYHIGLEHIGQEDLKEFEIITDTKQQFRLIGFSIQQYVSRTFKTGKRPVRAYDNIMKDIPKVIVENLQLLIPEQLKLENLNLGDIPFLYSLVPLAQTARSPIHALTSEDGLVGAHYSGVEEYKIRMQEICQKLTLNIQRVNG
jgi:cellulose biosynthesis protein BcsQ